MTNIDSLLFKIEMTRHTPYPGALLISEPFLREEYFCHSIFAKETKIAKIFAIFVKPEVVKE